MWVFILVFNLIYAAAAGDEAFYPLPRFWTNTGFCPPGDITHEGISNSLLSNEVKVNLQLIGSLPNGALSHVRIHWLLELIKLIEFGEHNIPKYDFSKLDKLVWWLDRRDLSLGFEFMGNPSEIFTKNESIADFLWEDLSFQIGKRYLNRLGPNKIEKWRFESWNEPDLAVYNILNYDIEKFQVYINALRRGLNAAGRRPVNEIHFNLHGPAGLFKASHTLCWQILEICNKNIYRCPLDVLTFHHKGSGDTFEVTGGADRLLSNIFSKYPNLRNIPVANDEADPIAGWSTPRDSQADMRYAVQVVSIIFDHWGAKLQMQWFKNLDFISHDNAFISYHPYEFSQRTLLAHFRMNNSKPYPYSQFIQKPVYAALGMLGNLASHAAHIDEDRNSIRVWMTSDENGTEFLSAVAISNDREGALNRFQKEFSLKTMKGANFSFVVEYLEYQNTDPFYVWNFYDSPPFPNRHLREAMRRSQGPRLFTTGALNHPLLYINLPLRSPWLVHVRICADSIPLPQPPHKLHIVPFTTNEILLLWKDLYQISRCVVHYQVWFLPLNATEWNEITHGWHTPFLSFHFAPKDTHIKGTYKVRSIDTFGRLSEFSKAKNYM